VARKPDARQRGFTLIEVVVAIAIVALGLMAVFRVVHATVNNAAYLRDRSFATWIADNRLTEMRLGTELPSVDETEGEVEFAGQSWRWVATVSQTPVEGLRRIDVRARRATDPEDSSLAQVSGFVGAVVMDTPPSGTLWTGVPDGQGQGDGEDEEGQDQAPDGGQDGNGVRTPAPDRGGEEDE
jgi:general secretion pathway protein I